MRKIGTDNQIEKRKKSTLAIGIFILVLMVLSTLGYAFIYGPGFSSQQDNPQSSEPTNVGGKWAVNFEGQTFYFTHSKDEVSEIEVSSTANLNDYVNTQLYVDSTNQAVNSELAAVLARYSSRIQRACYGSCEEDIPEKDCTTNLIVWKDAAESKVYQEQNCVFIEGDLRAVDAFLYHLLGMQ